MLILLQFQVLPAIAVDRLSCAGLLLDFKDFCCSYTSHPAFCLVDIKITEPIVHPFTSMHSLKLTSNTANVKSDVAELDQLLQSYGFTADAPSPLDTTGFAADLFSGSKPPSTSLGSSSQPGLIKSDHEAREKFVCIIAAAVTAVLQAIH